MSTEIYEATPRDERYGGEGGTVSTKTSLYAQQHWRAVSHASWRFACIVKAFYIIWNCQEKKKTLGTSISMPVCAHYTLTLQHVSLLALEGMLIPFLVVPTTAVETAFATLAQCPDRVREKSQIRQL